MPGGDDAQERDAIARSQRGDASAFNLLVTRYESAAYSLALRMLGNPESAADVAQDAFFSAFRNIRAFRGASFRAWLLRIVSNGCYDYWRAQGRRPTESLDALLAGGDEGGGVGGVEPELARALADPTWTPESAVLRAETVATIEAALLRLAHDQRLVIILSDVQGYSYEDIARIAGIPLGTVKSRIARARARLRDLLQGQSEPFPDRERRNDRGD
ncbi:MAG: sigma-70 family RNA polymerase sigma factor [Chloroflexota bacterium]|nr:sigma-70 family RNA polymerase sigma factor [Chloroflexota bacterium]